MSAALQQPPTQPVEPLPPTPRNHLFRAELHRFRSRRAIQVLAGLGVLVWAAAVVIGLLNFGEPTEADYAAAEAQMEQILRDSEVARQDCLENAPIPEGEDPDMFCGTPLLAEDLGGVEAFLSKAPFDLAAAGTGGALGFAGLGAAIAFLVGATWIGAEWSSRSMVALLFWAPRRVRVMATKVAVLVVGATVLGVAAQVGWLAMAGILDAVAGTGEALPDDFWSSVVQTQARGVLLVVLAALTGFGLTSIVRNTGATLGIAFVYVVGVQLILFGLRPSWSPWMLGTNAVALVQEGGLRIPFWDQVDYEAENLGEPVWYYLGHLQSGVFLTAVALVLVGVGTFLFTRRDIH